MDSGRISHQGSYQQLSLNGLIAAEALSDRFSDGDQGELVEETGDHSPQLPEQASATANNKAEATQIPSDFSVYSFFTRSMGIQGVFIFFAIAAALATEMSFQNVWLEKWASSNNPNSLVLYISVFTGLVFSGLGLLYVLCYLFFDILLTSSSLDLYFGQLKTLMRAPVSYALLTGSTTIANRFIQDIMLIDNELPMAFVNTTTSFFIAIGETVIILLASKYLLIAVPFLLTALWLLQRFYLRTSKQLRLMDIESKAPLSAFLNDTINGLASIRAFGRTREFQLNNRKRLEQSQKAMYMLYSVQVWLKSVLDFVVAIMAVAVASLAVNLRSSQSLGFLGLALVNLISLSSSFKYLITFWTELEASIGAVARIQQFKSSLPPEDGSQHPPPAVHWPTWGDISFRSTSASHQVNASLILSDLSLNISHGQKVAICGRSGSGKSSLLGTLLRTLEVTNGSIQVDRQDILKLPRDELRRRFITLPQKPVFLPGSIRQNINIWTDSSQSNDNGQDERIKDALVKVGIWDVLVTAYQQSLSPSESSSAVGFQTETTAMPQVIMVPSLTAVLGFEFDPTVALSHGQRQLFSLARLIFQCNSPNLNSPIVLLDEVTSSIDHETGMVMRRILHEVLQYKTVLEVIHLLDEKTVKDQFDLIVVMDSGRIVETGAPGELLLQHGAFRRLIDAGRVKSKLG